MIILSETRLRLAYTSATHNYRLSFIELKGIQVAEVCQIFDRINQAVYTAGYIRHRCLTKTFRLGSNQDDGFYLRRLHR